MKHLKNLSFAVMMLIATSSQAQDSNNPWAISFGVNAVDTRTSADTDRDKNGTSELFSDMFKVNDYWNTLPSVSTVGVARSVGDNLSVGIQGSINKITRYVAYNPSAAFANSSGYAVEHKDLMYYGIDANVKYSLKSLIKSKVIDPSVRLGGGYTFFGQDNGYGTINPGLGLTFWITENIGVYFDSTYKWSLGDREDGGSIDAPTHFQHSAGLVFQFGGKDTDKDGIYDKEDACPDVVGLKQFNGCPDTDGDGIVDGSDDCPEEAGIAAFNGCPDTDGDGVADKDDACPDTAGLAALKGCPDTDGDGVADKDDKCPTVAGPKSNGGCPVLDTDKDGVADKEDDCPTVAGPASNKGCPEVTAEVLEELKIQAKSVFFNSGKSTFKNGDASTTASLEAIYEIVKKYPNEKFSIEGHTDSSGSAVANQKISEDRANAVRNALIEKGVSADNLTAVGFGSTQPIASNKTAAGKAENRRTEVKHVSSK